MAPLRLLALLGLGADGQKPRHVGPTPPEFWMQDTGLAISFVFGLEAGGQPEFGAGPPTSRMDEMAKYLAERHLPDYPTRTWYEYGIHEGIPRLLDLFDDFGIKVSCLVGTAAARRSPALAREIVKRGHEPVCHGTNFSTLQGDLEREFLVDIVNVTRQITGEHCKGFNALWMQHTPDTNALLQELGFAYYVDDLSRDIPFSKQVNGKPMVIVPYSLRNHDIYFGEKGFGADEIYNQLVYEFEELHLESRKRRLMMTIPIHDNIGGIPATVYAYRKFLSYIQDKPNLWFARKDWLADWAAEQGPVYGCNSTDFICQADTCLKNCPEEPHMDRAISV